MYCLCLVYCMYCMYRMYVIYVLCVLYNCVECIYEFTSCTICTFFTYCAYVVLINRRRLFGGKAVRANETVQTKKKKGAAGRAPRPL